MLRICMAILGWHLTICGVSAEHTNRNNNHTGTSLLDKQRDYQLNFERVELVRYDKRYINVSIVTFKYNRTCPLVNFTITNKIDFGHSLEMVIQAYKFASNEYRTFPIRFEVNFCQAAAKNIAGVGEFHKCGTFSGCPLLKGKTDRICNWSPNTAMFPPFIPNGQYMIEVQALYGSVELFVLRGFGNVYRSIPILD